MVHEKSSCELGGTWFFGYGLYQSGAKMEVLHLGEGFFLVQ